MKNLIKTAPRENETSKCNELTSDQMADIKNGISRFRITVGAPRSRSISEKEIETVEICNLLSDYEEDTHEGGKGKL